MSDICANLQDLTIDGRPATASPARVVDRGKDGVLAALARRGRVLCDVFRPRLKARGLPFEYVIEVTSRCNLLCPMCPREISPELGNRDMDLGTFRRVLERIKGTASFLWLAGLGEPMMNRHFIQMIVECRRLGIATGVSTNGTFLTDKAQERILNSGLDLLLISFDGADKKTYEKVRIGADFDKVRDNVRRLAARKVRQNAKRPWLILQMIELSHTKGQADQFRLMWDIPGVDAVRIKKDELQFDESLTFEGQRKRTAKRPCPFLWRGTPLIQWDGTMLPCCYGIADKSFGNLNNASVEVLWNGKPVRDVRRAHLDGQGLTEPFCKSCNAFQPGRFPTALSVLIPSLTQKKYAGLVETLNRWVRFLE